MCDTVPMSRFAYVTADLRSANERYHIIAVQIRSGFRPTQHARRRAITLKLRVDIERATNCPQCYISSTRLPVLETSASPALCHSSKVDTVDTAGASTGDCRLLSPISISPLSISPIFLAQYSGHRHEHLYKTASKCLPSTAISPVSSVGSSADMDEDDDDDIELMTSPEYYCEQESESDHEWQPSVWTPELDSAGSTLLWYPDPAYLHPKVGGRIQDLL
jgi:hypothetical protein